MSNDLVMTRQEEKGQQKWQEPPEFELLSAAANSAIPRVSPVLCSLQYTSIMQIPKLRVKIFVRTREQNDYV